MVERVLLLHSVGTQKFKKGSKYQLAKEEWAYTDNIICI